MGGLHAIIIVASILSLFACDKKDDATPSTGTNAQPAAATASEEARGGREHERDREHAGDAGHERGDRGPH
jgi:hypothetical protein